VKYVFFESIGSFVIIESIEIAKEKLDFLLG